MNKTRAFALFTAILLLFVFAAPEAFAKKRARVAHGRGKITRVTRAAGVNDARYADIIMNPVTGEIYHSKDPDGKRYPASLTKMMTLYLLFDALEQGKTRLDARLDISDYAATMPQTNLALTPGDSISVETCIKALVVRSANDVAVVVAEALGGDVDHFAAMMTAKAYRLGMTNTVFKNPNGLPNTSQYTTARDMAKLGIALKRDFPRYYKYFSTLQFSHDGVTYYTHNRVMLRYAGVDGIKTGFIGASGFNLVTSVVRGGRPLVGAVMGGATGGWRDNRMIELLDDSYQIVASRGAVRGKMYPGNLPLPKNGGHGGVGVSAADLPTEDLSALANVATMPEASEGEDGGEAENPPAATVPATREAVRQTSAAATTPFEAAAKAEVAPAPVVTASVKPAESKAAKVEAKVAEPVAAKAETKAPVVIAPPAKATVVEPARSKVIQLAAPATKTEVAKTPFAAAEVPAKPVPLAAAGTEKGWGIQVGAFSTQALAVASSRNAMQLAAGPLAAAKMALADPVGSNVPVHRARLENLSQIEARKACEVLISNNSPCFIYKVSQ